MTEIDIALINLLERLADATISIARATEKIADALEEENQRRRGN